MSFDAFNMQGLSEALIAPVSVSNAQLGVCPWLEEPTPSWPLASDSLPESMQRALCRGEGLGLGGVGPPPPPPLAFFYVLVPPQLPPLFVPLAHELVLDPAAAPAAAAATRRSEKRTERTSTAPLEQHLLPSFGRRTEEARRMLGLEDASKESCRSKFPNKVKEFCNFCKNNQERVEVFSGHTLTGIRNGATVVTCPVLFNHTCELCGATGAIAHTKSYCPVAGKTTNRAAAVALRRTRRKSDGQLRRMKR